VTNSNEYNENHTADFSACTAVLNQLRHRLPRAELTHFDKKNINLLHYDLYNLLHNDLYKLEN